ncbi:hypothetical protein HSX11_19705 [Oxalobacteraceae bacterium]|nr:hypothetical protein [Oxalobacteraceae bacterium]
MSTISSLGGRTLPAPAAPSNGLQHDVKQTGSRSTAVGAPTKPNPVSLSNDAIGLQQRVASLGSATVDLAQDLLGSFAETLFGKEGKDFSIDFDSVSLEAESSAGLILQHSQGANGVTDSAQFQQTDSSHFIGKGTITTADGRSFEFEIEVQYEAQLDIGVSRTQSGTGGSSGTGSTGGAGRTRLPAPADSGGTTPADSAVDLDDGVNVLPSVQVPDIDFGGSLSDLFQLIGRNLRAAILDSSNASANADNKRSDKANSNAGDKLGDLTLRLLKLVDKQNAPDVYTVPEPADKQADNRARNAANSYGSQAAAGSDAVTGSPSAKPADQV